MGTDEVALDMYHPRLKIVCKDKTEPRTRVYVDEHRGTCMRPSLDAAQVCIHPSQVRHGVEKENRKVGSAPIFITHVTCRLGHGRASPSSYSSFGFPGKRSRLAA